MGNSESETGKGIEVGNRDKKINNLRNSIDDVDKKIVKLLNDRLLIGKQIGTIKESGGNIVLDTSREKKVMERLSKLNEGPMSDNVLHYIYSVIINASREIQKPLTISYLGPEATYSHIASMNHFGHSGNYIPKTNIGDVFSDVSNGYSHYGMVPVENSIEGAVNPTLDQLFDTDLKICAEKYQPISHDLLSLTGKMEDIKIITSHSQPLGQCRDWIQKNLPGVRIEECESTARAAQKASSEKSVAAIASKQAAELYKLKVVETKIEDYKNNVTRFLAIGKESHPKTGNDKSTIMFVTSNTPGALYKTLEPVSVAGLNMVKLESRPTKIENWNYFFVMDFEGHYEDSIVQEMKAKMKAICLFTNFLG